ncbi:MAG: hypothetical protein ACPLF9_06960 [Methanothermobacter tenebrarum]|nr:hypothetical protein [Methanobacteriaceae archaeon]
MKKIVLGFLEFLPAPNHIPTLGKNKIYGSFTMLIKKRRILSGKVVKTLPDRVERIIFGIIQ